MPLILITVNTVDTALLILITVNTVDTALLILISVTSVDPALLILPVVNVHVILHLGDLFWAPPDRGCTDVVLKRFIEKCDNEHVKGVTVWYTES